MDWPKGILLCLIPAFHFSCSNQQESESFQTSGAPIEVTQAETDPPIDSVRKPVRYKVKEGHISYTYDGIQRGTEEVYFADYGMVEIKFTETVRDNPFSASEEKISLITYMKDSAIFVVDLSTMNARKIDNTLLFESAEESATRDLNEVAESMYLDRGGFIEGKEAIAGVPCDRWFIESTKTREWRHKGMMMKTMIELPRNFVKVEAIAIDTISDLPENIFELPENVSIQDGMSMKQWIEELSKPVERRQVFDVRPQKER